MHAGITRKKSSRGSTQHTFPHQHFTSSSSEGKKNTGDVKPKTIKVSQIAPGMDTAPQEAKLETYRHQIGKTNLFKLLQNGLNESYLLRRYLLRLELQ